MLFPVVTPDDCLHGNERLGYFSQSKGEFFHFCPRTSLPEDTVVVVASDLTEGKHAAFAGKERQHFEQ